MVETIFTMLGAGMVGYSGYGIMQAIKDTRESYKVSCEESYRKKIEEPELNDYQIILGYRYFGGYKMPIIADMRNIPHILVCGLARQGKTKMVEYAMQGKNCILLNTDTEKDFLTLKAERINDEQEILEVLRKLVAIKKNDEVLYVVVDEILRLISTKTKTSKEIMSLLTQLLAYGSHTHIYVIALSQCAEKDIVDNKHLYNTRVCFKMLDESAYKVVLGKIPDSLYISKREFYYVTEVQGMGHTYDV